MRGKSTQKNAPPERREASMRPAHYAREVPAEGAVKRRMKCASMRPAHYAREVGLNGEILHQAVQASMRPAHYAREVRRRDVQRLADDRELQ